ncbi:MAG TPA: S-layer homology domain-containing protein, partial [Thermoanaerobacterales bacterium]|nr:S-layer homology domain-containing protein [Thermoanaerobacterales bacterium]
MKKYISLLTAIFCLTFIIPSLASAQGINFFSPGFEGGIANENEYAEMLFITGKPILLEGSYTISPGRMRGNVLTTNYIYKLSNSEEDVKLDRRITIETTFSKEETRGQTIAVSRITSSKENIKIG